MSHVCTRVRSLLGGAALVACLVPVAACSNTAQPGVSANGAVAGSTSAPTATAAPAVGVASTTRPPAPATTVAPPSSLLQSAVASRADRYHFRSTVTVNGAVTLTAEGDRIGTSSRLDLVSNGATVSYVITPAGSWARPEGGDWSAVSATGTTSDPIASLRHPSKVSTVSHQGDVERLLVTVPAAALGVGTSGTADVTVTITKGSLSRIDYRATAAGGIATVSNELSAVTDGSPITAPK